MRHLPPTQPDFAGRRLSKPGAVPPPPTRFGAAAGAQPKQAAAAPRRIPPPPTRFAASSSAQGKPSAVPAGPRRMPPPPTRFAPPGRLQAKPGAAPNPPAAPVRLPGAVRQFSGTAAARAIQRMEQKEEVPEEIIDYAPKEWVCPNCRNAVTSVYAPSFRCKKCGNGDWVLRQTKGGNNNNSDPDEGLDMRRFFTNMAQLKAIAQVSQIAWSKSGGEQRVSVGFGEIHARLLAWIDKLDDANKLPSGGRVHVENLDPENPEQRQIQRNIVTAQIGIMDLIVECMEDAEEYFSALGGAGVIEYFLSYLEVTQCNQHAAGQLRKRAKKIFCNRKS